MEYFIVFMLGAAYFSFLLCWCNDHPRQLIKRSSCDVCHVILAPWQLIPILGFLYQKGHCKTCGHPINSLYPLAECLGGILGLILFITHQYKVLSYLQILLILTLLASSVEDLFHLSITWPQLILSLVLSVCLGLEHSIAMWPGLYLWICLEFISWIFPNRFGGGDAKLIGILSLTLEIHQIPILLISSSLLGILHIMLLHIISQSKNIQNKPLAFIPALTLAYCFVTTMA